MSEFPEAETSAAKTEMREAFARRYKDDPRDPAMKFAIMMTILGELLAEAIYSAGKDPEHRETLLSLAGLQVDHHIKAIELSKAQEKET